MQFLQKLVFFFLFILPPTRTDPQPRGAPDSLWSICKMCIKKDLDNFYMFYWYAFVIICFHIVKSSELRGSPDQPTCLGPPGGLKWLKQPQVHRLIFVFPQWPFLACTQQPVLNFFQEYELSTDGSSRDINKNVIKINFLTFYNL